MYGLVLEGGGAKGSYQIGVYKALKEAGVEIGGVVGTSIGALNGAMIVQGDYEKCYDLWNNISYSMIIDAKDEDMERITQFKWVREDVSFLRGKIKSVFLDRGFDITPFKDSLDKHIDEDKIRNSGMDFGIVTINLSERKALEVFLPDIPEGQLKNYLIASSYLPIFKTEKIGGNVYLDGGFYDNLPFRMLKNKGYKDLILVRTHANGIVRKMDLGDSNAIIISPSEDLGKSYDCGLNRSRFNMKLGYYDGLKALNRYKGNRYYIVPKVDGDYYINYLLKIREEEVNKMQEILKLQQMPYRRALFESIIPKMVSILSMDKDSSYEDFMICLLEKKAENLNVERFEVYSFEKLLSKVEDKNIELNLDEQSKLDILIEKVDIIPIFNKDEILLQIADIIFTKR